MQDPGLDSVVRHSRNVLYRTLEGEAILVDLRSGSYFGLDPVGTFIWRTMEPGLPLREVLEAVLAAYEVDYETARDDLLRLTEDFLKRGLVEIAPVAVPSVERASG